nr:hypothetical protein [Marinicella sp. W31]MDC2877231.1 hypothetical protein [Marinicella sp. W31]
MRIGSLKHKRYRQRTSVRIDALRRFAVVQLVLPVALDFTLFVGSCFREAAMSAFKIAIIGAGSVGFTKTLFKDILCVPEFADIEVALTDVSEKI